MKRWLIRFNGSTETKVEITATELGAKSFAELFLEVLGPTASAYELKEITTEDQRARAWGIAEAIGKALPELSGDDLADIVEVLMKKP